MQHSKINWKFRQQLQPGFFLLTALLFIDLSFLIYQCSKIEQTIVCSLFGLYFIYLLLKKYSALKNVLALFLILAAVSVTLNRPHPTFSLTSSSSIELYPDQINLKDNWLTGVGKVKGTPVLVTATITDMQKKQLERGYQVVLTELNGEVKKIDQATNYGQFDLRKYYLGKNVTQQVNLKSCHIKTRVVGIINYLHYLRFCLQSYFKKMPQLLCFFSSELILGENPSQANQSILDHYRDLGVIHILSISGLHVGIYTILISTICCYFKLTEFETFACCVPLLLGGIFFSNYQAGFIRASLSYFLSQMLKFHRFPIAKLDLLGLTCLIHLLIDPRLMMQAGALLSYVLSLGLAITDKLPNFKQSLLLNIFLVPLLLFFFFQLNLLTVIFNLLIVPYFNYIILPLTFINLLTFSLVPSMGAAFEKILMLGEQQIGSLSASKIGLLTFGKINWWQCLLLISLTVILLADQNEPYFNRSQRKWLFQSIGWLYLILFLMIHFPLTGQVTFIDVGQGDSILITTPFPRRAYLIDTGGKLNFSKQKVRPQINKITLPFLKAQGISRLNGIFVTHKDTDHIGDLGPLMSQIPVERLYFAQGLMANPSFKKRIEKHIKLNQLVQLLAGQEIKEPQIKFNIVYPFKPGQGENKDCLSIFFKVSNKSWLFTGDLDQEGEQKLMAKYNLQANYFKLGHHGSKTSSNPDFLHKLAPEIVFISAGRNNRFGHPHVETIATLKKLGIPWVSTQDCGMISWTYSKFTKPKFNRFLK
ncbi:DNA internalization-related competence protein ComEC/Rec2 [Lactobacillus bombicola]|uniref:DNA internalization-related competence protein ComEC/Rec2 n=1 Tax=Lactobacillus bombicola TaxID=1505723 RepID=UPI000E581453|nr:DNA internalization-related competence protein ComEC/Rec2 [Lactobacillus bombicola]RHW50458.1 DNA internalization-related competence protein ComEC/Rec2 [Lactobacillus bombicola]